jgi:hypothetical protein
VCAFFSSAAAPAGAGATPNGNAAGVTEEVDFHKLPVEEAFSLLEVSLSWR